MAGSGLTLRPAPPPAEVPATPGELLDYLGGPALLTIEGRDPTRCRAVSTLLHGNEPSGLRALHAWLRAGDVPAVQVACFVGAVAAARIPPGFAHRALPGRRDLNRCFREPFDGDEGALARAALAGLRAARPEALVDLHNNTGHNPPYAVGARIDAPHLALAGLFAERFVHSDIVLGTLVEALDGELPAVTIECGRVGDPAADAVALAGLRRYVGAPTLPAAPAAPLHVLGSPVRVRLRPGARVAFAPVPVPGAALTLAPDIDRHNFQALPAGTLVGWLEDERWPIQALGAAGVDVSHELFVADGKRLATRRECIPIMMTTDPAVAEGDCLFYLVQAHRG